MKQVVVIGGGAAGLAASRELARRGIATTLVERSADLGGLSRKLACKGAPHCLRCDACYPNDLLQEVTASPLVRIVREAEVMGFEAGGTEVAVRTPDGVERFEAGAVILATGALPYDASRDPRLRHGDCPDVLSSLEVERELSERGHLVVPSTGRPPREMAIVQCVGSRDVKRGVPYCSKACCKYAFKLACHLRSADPELGITFFFMDWRPLEDPRNALDVWAAGDPKVRVVRARPAEVLNGARPIVRYAPPGEFVAEEAFDLVMLTVGLVPDPDNRLHAERFGLDLDGQGSLSSDGERVLVAGTCRGPKDIRESVEEGIAAAGRAARLVGVGP